jgi:ribosomal protein L29
MKLSINTSIISKIDKDLLKEIESKPCWQTVDVTTEEAFELIATHGVASTCELRNNVRREANYASRQLFMIDMDDGMTIPELLADPFYTAYGAGFYATSSFTPELHKFRILFITEQPIDNARLSRLIIQGLRLIYPQSDRACVDPARLFYGNAHCVLKEYTGQVLPDEVIAALVTEVMDQQEQREVVPVRPLDDFKSKTAEEVIELLRELRRWYPDLSYAPRRDVTWAIASTLGQSETVSIMRSIWPDGDKTVAYEQFIQDHKRVAITLGTIYHMIRQHDPTYGKALRQLTLDELKNKLQKTKGEK